LNDKATTKNLAETILQITAQKKPGTVNQLVELVREVYPASSSEILDAIVKLQSEGKLKLATPSQQTPEISAYLRTSAALWFWATIALAFATLIAVFAIPETSFPLVYVRYVLGAIFVLWLPGYAFIKALFPTQVPIKTSSENLDSIERVALSIGLSLALVPIVGLLLNYTPWGIRLEPVTLSLTALTLTFATAALLRENETRKKRNPKT